MKAILPILICSAISAGLGYYFGHITVPATPEAADAASAFATAPTPQATQATAPIPQPAPPVPAPAPPAPAPVEAPEVAAPADEPSPPPSQATYAERAALPVQTFTDTQGRSMQASVIKVTETDVKIRRSDGLETTIPLNMLSEEDVAFCNYLREQQESEPAEIKTPDNSDAFDWDAYFNS